MSYSESELDFNSVSDFDSASESDSESEFDSSLAFMNLDICIFSLCICALPNKLADNFFYLSS